MSENGINMMNSFLVKTIEDRIDLVDNQPLIEPTETKNVFLKRLMCKFVVLFTCNCDESNKGTCGISFCLTRMGISKEKERMIES